MSSPYLEYGSLRPGTNPDMYPPKAPSPSPPSTIHGKHDFAPGRILRTPSPTPSEAAELARDSLFDRKKLTRWRFWIRREWLWYYVIGAILTVITALITIYHHQIVHALTPAAHWMKSLPGGWSIPIAVLFVISFPPLFGHEIVAILCGIVWGLWIGFAIVAAGTFLGELGNFYAFKYCCRARGEKLERTNLQYGCLAHVVRGGGFRIALIARFSAIPGHFTTAVFATCGMSIWIFSLATFISLPKQLAIVYIGVIIDQAGKQGSVSQRIASYSLVVVTTIVTFLTAWYIYRKLNLAKPAVIYERRKARQAKMELTGSYYHNNVSTISAFNANSSESDIPLQPSRYDPERHPGSEESIHQQWDEMGRAIGYAPDSLLHAPRPRPPSIRSSALYAPPTDAAPVILPRHWEDELPDAPTPKITQPPDVAHIPARGPPSDAHAPPLATSSFSPAPQSPGPLSSATASRYATNQPEPIAGNLTSDIAGTGAAQQQYYQSATGFGPMEPRRLSPPPTYP